MNYLQTIAREIYEAAHPGDSLPADQEAVFLIYAVLVRSLGRSVAATHVHDAWAAWRSTTLPDHQSLVPFDALPAEEQALDARYVDAIRAVAEAAG